jgi:hypothetical protein
MYISGLEKTVGTCIAPLKNVPALNYPQFLQVENETMQNFHRFPLLAHTPSSIPYVRHALTRIWSLGPAQ